MNTHLTDLLATTVDDIALRCRKCHAGFRFPKDLFDEMLAKGCTVCGHSFTKDQPYDCDIGFGVAIGSGRRRMKAMAWPRRTSGSKPRKKRQPRIVVRLVKPLEESFEMSAPGLAGALAELVECGNESSPFTSPGPVHERAPVQVPTE